MTCPRCQSVMPAGLRVCGECGASLATTLTPALTDATADVPGSEDAAKTTVSGEDRSTADQEDEPLGEGEGSLDGGAALAPVDEQSETTAEQVFAELLPADMDVASDDDGFPDDNSDESPQVVALPPLAPEESRQTLPAAGGSSRTRFVLIGTAAVLTVAFYGALVTFGVLALGSPANPMGSGGPDSRPASTSAPAAEATRTLPGFATDASWSASGVDSAAAAGERVLGVVDDTVSVWDARSGELISHQKIGGSDVTVTSGRVDGDSAVAASSDTEALVWIGDTSTPVALDLASGRHLDERSGSVVVTGPDTSFSAVTSEGEAALVAPRPGMIVLGLEGESVVWAGSQGRVVVASRNGTVLSDTLLSPPTPGAEITPRTGWVRAATTSTVIVGWTLPDGSTVSGVHAAATGEMRASFPGTGEGSLSADGSVWLSDGQLTDLATGTLTPLPDGFVASRFLGSSLYGALETGEDAVLQPGADEADAIPASTVRPLAVVDDALITLTSGELSIFPAAKN